MLLRQEFERRCLHLIGLYRTGITEPLSLSGGREKSRTSHRLRVMRTARRTADARRVARGSCRLASGALTFGRAEQCKRPVRCGGVGVFYAGRLAQIRLMRGF